MKANGKAGEEVEMTIVYFTTRGHLFVRYLASY